MEKAEIKPFYNYLNTASTSIKFTELLEKLEQLVLLDLNVQQLTDGSLSPGVYRKPTHTDRYLQYFTNYAVNQKLVWLVH